MTRRHANLHLGRKSRTRSLERMHFPGQSGASTVQVEPVLDGDAGGTDYSSIQRKKSAETRLV